ncbi:MULTISPECIES: lipid A biosynthesis acyltransferase [unclassified Janthinobacterium]|uniref:LpxL/LpxP family acyltransferase n=1 Tax=unclassified Janthinobacterium TaxID=2610881 RepID=UPI00160A29BC|nr:MULTISPECIES: lipid A biosynthesis acyltransferase [unclassified Janthinobacterium]MBB5605756.1 KDO2-lipid IV(A) lauroyltransferase [Janthinobacterium sp. S3T4]MBB5611325.1 KDO2-lipid IV(A) lauroyltransferase [Janthinobacterium sp. S3M3]
MRLLLALMWLLHWLPLPILGRFGVAVGSLLFIAMPSRRKIALTNLRLCMPELSEKERVALARQHFQAYSRSVWERAILWWASEERLNRLIKKVPAFPGQLIASKPTILLCPHFVCLDVAGAATAMEISASSMYAQQKNAVFDKALRDGRSRFKPSKLFTRQDGIKPILRALRDNLPYFMLPDMDFGEKDAEFVPFFGVPAATLTATARLALAARAQVIPVIATFLPDYQGWKVTYYPPWDDYPGDDITAATRRMNAFIEERVREAPAEYFWTHKRFKTRPEGEASFYHNQDQ